MRVSRAVTHLNHGVLVRDLPPRLLRVVVDPDDGLRKNRISPCARRTEEGKEGSRGSQWRQDHDDEQRQ